MIQRHERSRERILDAFLVLENREDIHTLSVSALCEEADTSRTTFYKYFTSVDDVADSVMERMLDQASPLKKEDIEASSAVCGRMPLCQYVRCHPEYMVLFRDHSVQERLMEKIIAWNMKACSGTAVPDAVLRCQASCCMSLIRLSGTLEDAQWKKQKESVDQFVAAGLRNQMNADKEETIRFPYGSQFQSVRIPHRVLLQILDAEAVSSSTDEDEMIADSLRHPHGRSLDGIVHPGEHVAILTSDNTRSLPAWKILPHVLRQLQNAGIEQKNITIVFAIGIHPPLDEAAMRRLVGAEISEGYQCVNSDPQDTVYFGTTQRGTPVYITRTVAEADRRICLGNVEFNNLTGYSGGANALIPGTAGAKTIRMNHGLSLRRDTAAGVTEGNPVFEDIREAAHMVRVDFIVNVVLDRSRRIIFSSAGELDKAHQDACRFLNAHRLQIIRQKADIVIASAGGAPRDNDLITIGKALANAARAVKDGGIIILAGAYGNECTNNEFLECLIHPEMFSDDMPYSYARHCAAIVMPIRARVRIYLVSSMDPQVIRNTQMVPFREISSAYAMAKRQLGKDASVIAMPYALDVCPEERA